MPIRFALIARAAIGVGGDRYKEGKGSGRLKDLGNLLRPFVSRRLGEPFHTQ